jgi:hypothetical protein
LSTLVLALLADKSIPEHQYILRVVLKAGEDRLDALVKEWNACLEEDAGSGEESKTRRARINECRPSILRAINCIEQLQQAQNQTTRENEEENFKMTSRRVSETMIMSDLFSYHYNKEVSRGPSNQKPHVPHTNTFKFEEWPVWCGKLQVLLWVARGPFHGFSRTMLEANVFLLSPNFNQFNFLAWDSMTGQDDNDDNIARVGLVAETYNFLPTPPMGRLVGVTEEDEKSLQTIALRLGDQNTVAILSPQLQSATPNRYMQNVRVITRSQGRDRLKNVPSLPFASYVNGLGNNDTDDAKDLLCCWQFNDTYQDAIVTTARDCIPHFRNILKNKEKCMFG